MNASRDELEALRPEVAGRPKPPPTQLSLHRGDVVRLHLHGACGAELNDDGYRNGRPAVVIQNRHGNERSPMVLVALVRGVHGKQLRRYPEQVFVGGSLMGLDGIDSTIECGVLRTVDRQRIHERGVIARLPPNIMREIDQALMAAMALGKFSYRA